LILLLVPSDKGSTKVVVGQAKNFEKTKYTAGTIEGPASDVKLKKVGKDSYVFACASPTNPDGSIHNPETAEKSHSSGRLYKSLFVRHWDHYVAKARNSIWYGMLSLSKSEYKLSPLTNALNGTGLSSPIDQSTGGGVNFDIGPYGLVFVAKDPCQNPANHTKQNLYIATANGSGFKAPTQIAIPGFEGASSNTVLSPDGKSLAFTAQQRNGYEADKNQLFVIPDIRRPTWLTYFYATADGSGRWDRSVDGIVWSNDGETLYVTAQSQGAEVVYRLPANALRAIDLPRQITRQGSVDNLQALSNGELFVSTTSFVDDSAYYILDPSDESGNLRLISSNSHFGSKFGLSASQVSEIRFPGAETEIQAFVIKPSTFSVWGKYPVAFLIHGGPQGAWNDAWSTRWNPAVFAEQGYIVVAPNQTGSTGFGQKLTDAIQNEWGGLPYQDIVKCVEYVEQNFEYVNMNRAVALGASYGGYMMNWIQGQPLGRKFKALVTHDGAFSMTGQLASEELWFPEHEFGGKYWENRQGWLKWDPSRFVGNWATPHLIIHSEKDYRLTMAEGLSVFNVLQEKGIESKFLVFPDENHWVLKPENSLLWHAVVLDWINSHVGLPKYGNKGYPAQLLKDADMSVEVVKDGIDEGELARKRGRLRIEAV
jgi:dipeptidyl aminopeptidase/acylaminoacyl peptidase